MSFLSAGTKKTGTAITYTGLQLQTSVATLPIPLGWGRFKLAPNIIWYNNFQKHAQKQSAGKGLGGGSATTYTYSADVILGLCEGPITGIAQVWKNGTIYTVSQLGLTLFLGSTPQTPWSYLSSSYPQQALSYQGTAYLCEANYDLGSSASLPTHSLEVIGKYAGTGTNGADADPALVIEDALTNPQYSPNFPANELDLTTLLSSAEASTNGDAACQTYWRAVGISISPILTSIETAQSVLQRWQKLLNIAIFDSGGLVKFVPYGDAAITANGVTYVPDLTPVFDLIDDDYQEDKSNDPLNGQITDIYEAYNVERLTISDRANAYNSTVIEARDEAAVNTYGLRIDTSVSAMEICDKAVAAIAAQLILQRQLYVRNTYPIKLDERYCGLDPMDIITLTDSAMGMEKVLVRIQTVEEADDGTLTLTVEELPVGVGTATAYPKESSTASGVLTNYTVASSVNVPIIFEPPPDVTGGQNQVWIGASGAIGGVADPLWGGADVYISLDGDSYNLVGTISTPCRQGVLVENVGALGGAAYWRFTCSADTTSSNSDLAEVVFYDASGIAIDRTGGTASGSYTSGQVPSNAFDGNMSTFWECYVGSGTAQIMFVFPVAKPVASIEFFCRTGETWGPANIVIEASADGQNWSKVGTLNTTSWTDNVGQSVFLDAPYGVLTVDLTQSGGVLSSASSAVAAANGATLSYLNGEVIDYTTATLVAGNQYKLSGLYRGQDGTTAVAQNVGALFARLDSAFFIYDLPEKYVGMTLYVKLASFNADGSGKQDLSDCEVFEYIPMGSGSLGPVSSLLALGIAMDYGAITDAVNESDDFGTIYDDIGIPIELGATLT